MPKSDPIDGHDDDPGVDRVLEVALRRAAERRPEELHPRRGQGGQHAEGFQCGSVEAFQPRPEELPDRNRHRKRRAGGVRSIGVGHGPRELDREEWIAGRRLVNPTQGRPSDRGGHVVPQDSAHRADA